MIDVKSYGAFGNGINDDTAAIQAPTNKSSVYILNSNKTIVGRETTVLMDLVTDQGTNTYYE